MITLEEVKAAYEKTGLSPTRSEWYSKEANCACAMGALAVADSCWDIVDDLTVIFWVEKKYGKDFVEAFTWGFDGYPNIYDEEIDREDLNDEEYAHAVEQAIKLCEAYKCGKEIGDALFD